MINPQCHLLQRNLLICPKCECELPEDASWQVTKNHKNWIRMPDGKWHDCDSDKPSFNKTKEKNYKRTELCHECHSITLHCGEYSCALCKFGPSFCPGCDSHVSVVDVKFD